MSRHSTRLPVLLLALCVGAMTLLTWPGQARADIFKLWVAGRGDYFSGTGDLFTEFESPAGGGVEAGIELMGISLFTEGLVMGADQYLMTGNLGFDLTLGDDVRFHIGAFTGPILFFFPQADVPPGIDFSQLSPEQQAALQQAAGKSLDELETEFSKYAEDEKDLSSLAFGWNLGRARLAVDFQLVPGFYLGVAGQVGYHMLISGEEVAAGAKNEALNKFADENNVPDILLEEIRPLIGAEPVDQNNLNGVNWDTGIYLRIELGT